MRATNRELKNSENPDSYTTVVAKNKLMELGFTNFLDSLKMYTYYLKKASKQDVEKTTVINTEAVTQFFGVSLINKDDTDTVSIHYLSDNTTDTNVQLLKKQDPRIFIDRTRFSEGDLLLYISKGHSVFDLEVITNQDDRYQSYLSSLTHNYLLCDNLPIKNPSLVDLFNEDNNKEPMTNEPLNQILFGPPGTGKTYSTITKALDIIGIKHDSYPEAQELFQEELGKRIEFVTMHQSYSYEDFVQGLKPKKSEDGNGIVFDYKNGVFKEICRRAKDAETGDSGLDKTILTNKEIGQIMFFLSKFNGKGKDEKKANDFLGYESDYKAFSDIGEKIGVKPNTLSNHRDKFDYMFKDRVNYSARKGWVPRNNQGVLDNSKKWPYKEIYDEMNPKSFEEVSSLVATLLSKNKVITTEKEGNNNHVIILDEINRANISRVFGELIALIEKDKRDGKLTVTLPSGEPFTVPTNLYIIGTMNTADKSIALVDIALRRRFEFIPLYPDPKILKDVLLKKKLDIKDVKQRVELFSNLNRIIRAKKSIDFEIGHSYFMEDDSLTNILNKQILPLLNEYFMYDLKKVKDVIEKQQKDGEGNPIPKLSIVLNTEVWRERGG
jgi:5-methylcytosine-specific restriction protein B